jgi:hypothetical protein
LAGFTVDLEASYTDEMERLQRHIRSTKLDSTYETLLRLTTSMTSKEKDQRPTSLQVWTELYAKPEYACTKCISEYALKHQQTSAPIPPGLPLFSPFGFEFNYRPQAWLSPDRLQQRSVFSNGNGISIPALER